MRIIIICPFFIVQLADDKKLKFIECAFDVKKGSSLFRAHPTKLISFFLYCYTLHIHVKFGFIANAMKTYFKWKSFQYWLKKANPSKRMLTFIHSAFFKDSNLVLFMPFIAFSSPMMENWIVQNYVDWCQVEVIQTNKQQH